MTTVVTLRSVKGSALTWTEMDNNFINLRNTADAAAKDSLAAHLAGAETFTGFKTLSGGFDGTIIAGVNGNQQTTLAAALRQLDGMVMPVVKQVSLNTPAASPAHGDCYIVGASPTGAWAGQAGKFTRWSTTLSAWEFYTPKQGWWVADQTTGNDYYYNGSAWAVWGQPDANLAHLAGTETFTGAKTFSLGVTINGRLIDAGSFTSALKIQSANSSASQIQFYSSGGTLLGGCGYFAADVFRTVNAAGTTNPMVAGPTTATFGDNSGAFQFNITGQAGTLRGFALQTVSSTRWYIYAGNIAETGSDAGSGLFFGAYNDSGVFIDAPIQITRASGGLVTLGGTTSRNLAICGTTNGAQWTQGVISEQITLSTGGTTTDSVANLLPANAIIEAVVARVTTTIAGATNWSLGDATVAARFAAANSTLAAGTTSVGLQHVDQTGTSGPKQTAASKLRITTTGTPTAGVIRVTVYYRTFTAPTS